MFGGQSFMVFIVVTSLLLLIERSNSDQDVCQDSDEQCRRWASVGECDKNPDYMLRYCQKSCNSCHLDFNNVNDESNSKQQRKKVKKKRTPRTQEKIELKNTESVDAKGRKIKYQYGDPNEVNNIDLSTIDTSMCPESFPNCTACRDINDNCQWFAKRGECELHPGWMVMNCGQTCKLCHMHDYYTRCTNPQSSPIYANMTHIHESQVFKQSGDLNKLFISILRYYIEHKFIIGDINWEYSILSKPSSFSVRKLINDIENEYAVKIDRTIEQINELLDRLIFVETNENDNPKSKNGPWVVLFDKYMNEEESKGIIDAAPPFQRSTDVGQKDASGHFQQITSKSRTSLNSWCQTECWNKPMVQQVMTRVEDLFNISMDNTEHLQILEYSPGQYYKTHHDYIGQQIGMPCGPRILTFYMYLSDVEEGGETAFPKLKLSVKPKLGRAILWPSVRDDAPNQIDSRTYHEARPVIKGTKYGANSWFHLFDFQTPNIWSCTG